MKKKTKFHILIAAFSIYTILYFFLFNFNSETKSSTASIQLDRVGFSKLIIQANAKTKIIPHQAYKIIDHANQIEISPVFVIEDSTDEMLEVEKYFIEAPNDAISKLLNAKELQIYDLHLAIDLKQKRTPRERTYEINY